jgi:hypothetical protein
VKREEREIVRREEESDSVPSQHDDMMTDYTKSPKKGKGSDMQSMTSSPFKISQSKTMKTGFNSSKQDSDTASLMTVGTAKTRQTGGLADLLKLPNMDELPVKIRRAAPTGGLDANDPRLAKLNRQAL